MDNCKDLVEVVVKTILTYGQLEPFNDHMVKQSQDDAEEKSEASTIRLRHYMQLEAQY